MSDADQVIAIRVSSEIVFIAGKDPCRQKGGHASYVRAHARAAVSLGFTPHLFYVGRDDTTIEGEFGVLHEVASRARPLRPIMLPFHGPRLVRAIRSFLDVRPGPHLLHTFGFWLGIGLEVRRQLREDGCEALHISSVYSTFKHEYGAKLRGAFSGDTGIVAKAAQVAEYAFMHYLRARHEAAQLRESDVILVNYDSVSRIIASEYGPDIKCRRLPYSSEKAFLHRSESLPKPEGLSKFSGPEGPLIVAVSRHDPRKGIVYLLSALAALRDSGVAFRACLIGGGLLTEAHRRFARKLGLDGCVAIEGWVTDPLAYLNQADIFVLPSIEEGSGSVALLEALQAGLPIVASDIDGIPEDVTEREAILVEPRNSAALADALRRLLLDPALRARMARSARERYESAFSAGAFTRALGSLYAEYGFHPNR